MMPITRQEIEILLDTQKQRNFVVSAYADLRVQNGFDRYVDQHLRNQAREAGAALAEADAEARQEIEANVEVIRRAVREVAPASRGVAVFSGIGRGLRQVVPLDFPVENHLVIDEEPFLLPLLERWHGEPSFLIALADSDEAHLFEVHHGPPERVHDLEREDSKEEIQRDKPRFTYKKRFARTRHEHLHGAQDDKFLREVSDAIRDHWQNGNFAGLILLGHPTITAPLRRLLPRDVEDAVIGEAPHAMSTRPDDFAAEATRMIARWQAERERQLMAELQERWKRKHLVASGPTDVLDALQQGRATQVVLGRRRDIPGAYCRDCGYHFGAPVGRCPYCQGACRAVNAAQDILRLAVRHRVPVLLFHPDPKHDPLEPAGGVAALLRAEADWAPRPDSGRMTATLQGAVDAHTAARSHPAAGAAHVRGVTRHRTSHSWNPFSLPRGPGMVRSRAPLGLRCGLP